MSQLRCTNNLPVAVMLLMLVAGNVLSGSQGTDLTEDPPATYMPTDSCQIGNLNPPVGPSYPELFNGNESYAYHVKPSDQCACAEDHFRLDAITMLVDFAANQVPQTLTVTPSLLSAVNNGGTGCLEPGPPVCVGADVTVTVTTAGIQNITVPLVGCGPHPLGMDYFLSLAYEGGGPASLPIDNDPQACTEFFNTGNGWVDLMGLKSDGDKTGGGKLIVFGDIVCVSNVVDLEPRTWGTIKSLFR